MADTELSALTEDTAPAETDWWYKVNSGGTVDRKVSTANLRAIITKPPTQQVLTVGSGTYTTPAGCKAIIVEVTGAGGGGGGGSGGAAQCAGGSGGGSGGYAQKHIASPDATYAYTVGAKGAGGIAGANNGSAGTDSTFGAGGGLITAKAGVGGIAMATGATLLFAEAGVPGAISTGGDINARGGAGSPGIRLSGTVVHSGNGGGSFYGGAPKGRTDSGTGVAASCPGAGGGGGSIISTGNSAGGDGADGLIVVREFY